MKHLNLKLIYRFLGITAILNGVFMWLALPFSFYHEEEAKLGILNSGLIAVFIGTLLYVFNKPKDNYLQKKEGYLIVTLGWLILSFTGMLIILH